jgi:NADPH-dependent 7-cyano-7-deazaguanine reductase QueF-like protein
MNNFMQNKKINVNELCNINIENLFNTTQYNHMSNPNDTIINNKIVLNVNNLIESKSFKCNVDDNYIIKKIKNIEIDEKRKMNELYEKKYNDCLKKINDAIDIGLTDIFFKVNTNFFGYKDYTSRKCLEYIQNKLRDKKFETYIHSNTSIFISWKSL